MEFRILKNKRCQRWSYAAGAARPSSAPRRMRITGERRIPRRRNIRRTEPFGSDDQDHDHLPVGTRRRSHRLSLCRPRSDVTIAHPLIPLHLRTDPQLERGDGMGRAGSYRRPSELRPWPPACPSGRAPPAEPVRNVSYSLRPAFWFVWRWRTDYSWGRQTDTGLSLGRGAARRKARTRLREAWRASGRDDRGASSTSPPALDPEGRQEGRLPRL